MRLIAAALNEELRTALDLCSAPTKLSIAGSTLWQAGYGGITLHFLKTGVGPVGAGKRLLSLLGVMQPASILAVGYAGALDPTLKVGSLVVGRKASILGERGGSHPPLELLELSGSWELAMSLQLAALAETAHVSVHTGEFLTCPYIIGEPAQKEVLFRRFNAAAIDMETAALARTAAEKGIPLSCVRSVSDEADDEFLAPFSYDPQAGLMRRAAKVVGAGHWIKRSRAWRERSATARASLSRFLQSYLEWIDREASPTGKS